MEAVHSNFPDPAQEQAELIKMKSNGGPDVDDSPEPSAPSAEDCGIQDDFKTSDNTRDEKQHANDDEGGHVVTKRTIKYASMDEEGDARVMALMEQCKNSDQNEIEEKHGTKIKMAINLYEKFVAPVGDKVLDVYMTVEPVLEQVWEKIESTAVTIPFDLLYALYGLVICYFGGVFVACIACFEAVKTCGWRQVKRNMLVLWENAKTAHKSLVQLRKEKQDDPVSVQEAVIQALSAVDPMVIQYALAGIQMSFFAVFAALRVKFARVIVLGISIGDYIRPTAERYLVPVLTMIVPEPLHKWIPVGVNYLVKSLSCTLAFLLQQIVSAIQSSVAGGRIAARSIIKYGIENGLYKEAKNLDDTILDEYIGYALALSGIWFQLTNYLTLPFPLNILLFPLTTLEWFIRYWIMSE